MELFSIVLALFAVFAAAFHQYFKAYNRKKVASLHAQIYKYSSPEQVLRSRYGEHFEQLIRQVFYLSIKARNTKLPDKIKDYFTEDLYKIFKQDLISNYSNIRIGIQSNSRIIITPIEMKDTSIDNSLSVWIYFQAMCPVYELRMANNRQKLAAHSYDELWRFVRKGGHWLAADILSGVDASFFLAKHTGIGGFAIFSPKEKRILLKVLAFTAIGILLFCGWIYSNISPQEKYQLQLEQLYNERKYDEALLICTKQIAENHKDSFFHKMKGNILVASGKPMDGLAELSTAYKLNPNDEFILTDLSSAYYRTGGYTKAVEFADLSLEMDPDYSTSLVARANALAGLGSNIAALSDYEQVIAGDKSYSQAFYGQGLILYRLGKYSEADQSMNSFIQLAADDFKYSDAPYCKSNRNDSQFALKCLDKALKLDPKDIDLLYQKVDCYIISGDIQNALECLNSIIKLDSDKAHAYYQRAILLTKSGDSRGAISALKQAIVLDKYYAEIADEDKELNSLRRLPEYQKEIK